MKNTLTRKNSKMFVYSTLISFSFIVSCQTETAPIQDSLEFVVEELMIKAKKEQSAINTVIKKTGNVYTIGQIESIDNLALGLHLVMDTNISNKKLQFTDVVVTCSDSGEFTVCGGSGMSQKLCVAKAIKDCFNEGECAEVCEQEMLIIPPDIK